jgi:tRNA (uracil-5-)-methyltransferase TRM9
MKKQTVTQLLQQNSAFYQKYAEEFAATRNYIWQGWNRVGEYLKKFDHEHNLTMRVLDLGCGNGRLYKFLADSGVISDAVSYKGVDDNKYLIDTAQNKYGINLFSLGNALEPLTFVGQGYNVVTAFGLTHHLPSKELRAKWFTSLCAIIAKEGVICLSFWHFDINKAVATSQTISEPKDLENNDYFLGWDNKNDTPRYCHYFDENEINEIIKLFDGQGFVLAQKYQADGKDAKSNTYLIFARM